MSALPSSTPRTHAPAPQAAMTTLTPAQCDVLESLLADLEQHARASARLADEHRNAISTADAANLARCVAAQQQSASQLNTLEARRVAFLRSIGLRAGAAPMAGPGGAAASAPSVTLSQLAALAPKPRAATLTATAARVRTLLADASQRRESVRLASLSLMGHMQGILRQITRYLSDTKTYTPPHRLLSAAAGTTAGSLDFTT